MQTADIVQRAIDYIEEHLEESLALEQIAEAAAMSVPDVLCHDGASRQRVLTQAENK